MTERRPPAGKTSKRGRAARRKAAGEPEPSHIVAQRNFPSPSGRTYTILTTSETDPYDDPAEP